MGWDWRHWVSQPTLPLKILEPRDVFLWPLLSRDVSVTFYLTVTVREALSDNAVQQNCESMRSSVRAGCVRAGTSVSVSVYVHVVTCRPSLCCLL